MEKFKYYGVRVLIGLGVLALLAILVFGVLAIFAATRGGFSGSRSYNESVSMMPGISASDGYSAPSAPSYSNSYEKASSDVTKPILGDKKIIKNGELNIEAIDADELVASTKKTVAKVDGFVDTVDVNGGSGYSRQGTIVARVPVAQFEKTFEEVKGLASKITRESVNAKDITEEYVDLDAQLSNMRAVEQEYRNLLSRSGNLSDVLSVTREIANVRNQIDGLTARLKYYDRQVEYSTIRISFYEQIKVGDGSISWRPWLVVKAEFKNLVSGLENYVDSMIGFLLKLPVIILWVVSIAALVYLAYWLIVVIIILKVWSYIKSKRQANINN